MACGTEMRTIIVTCYVTTHQEDGQGVNLYLLLLFLQLFVLHILELGPHKNHFFLQLRSAELIYVQHEGELHVLLTQQRWVKTQITDLRSDSDMLISAKLYGLLY